jgi:hypothetical protein
MLEELSLLNSIGLAIHKFGPVEKVISGAWLLVTVISLVIEAWLPLGWVAVRVMG